MYFGLTWLEIKLPVFVQSISLFSVPGWTIIKEKAQTGFTARGPSAVGRIGLWENSCATPHSSDFNHPPVLMEYFIESLLDNVPSERAQRPAVLSLEHNS